MGRGKKIEGVHPIQALVRIRLKQLHLETAMRTCLLWCKVTLSRSCQQTLKSIAGGFFPVQNVVNNLFTAPIYVKN